MSITLIDLIDDPSQTEEHQSLSSLFLSFTNMHHVYDNIHSIILSNHNKLNLGNRPDTHFNFLDCADLMKSWATKMHMNDIEFMYSINALEYLNSKFIDENTNTCVNSHFNDINVYKMNYAITDGNDLVYKKGVDILPSDYNNMNFLKKK